MEASTWARSNPLGIEANTFATHEATSRFDFFPVFLAENHVWFNATIPEYLDTVCNRRRTNYLNPRFDPLPADHVNHCGKANERGVVVVPKVEIDLVFKESRKFYRSEY
jgi:hypothetical protein